MREKSMDETLNRFLTESPLAEKIKLPAAVVVHRTALCPLEVKHIRSSGVYGPIPEKEEVCELHVGGRRIAVGNIVKRRGEYYFKVGRLTTPEEKEKEKEKEK
jgi:hypothetical protein